MRWWLESVARAGVGDQGRAPGNTNTKLNIKTFWYLVHIISWNKKTSEKTDKLTHAWVICSKFLQITLNKKSSSNIGSPYLWSIFCSVSRGTSGLFLFTLLELQPLSKYFETFWCFNKFSFHHKGKDARLFLTNMVYTNFLTSYRTT